MRLEGSDIRLASGGTAPYHFTSPLILIGREDLCFLDAASRLREASLVQLKNVRCLVDFGERPLLFQWASKGGSCPSAQDLFVLFCCSLVQLIGCLDKNRGVFSGFFVLGVLLRSV